MAHWSDSIEWRAGRWDAMSSAPTSGWPIVSVRGRRADGSLIENMHYAHDESGEYQPAFRGWFVPAGSGFHQVQPVEWQPTRAEPVDPDEVRVRLQAEAAARERARDRRAFDIQKAYEDQLGITL